MDGVRDVRGDVLDLLPPPRTTSASAADGRSGSTCRRSWAVRSRASGPMQGARQRVHPEGRSVGRRAPALARRRAGGPAEARAAPNAAGQRVRESRRAGARRQHRSDMRRRTRPSEGKSRGGGGNAAVGARAYISAYQWVAVTRTAWRWRAEAASRLASRAPREAGAVPQRFDGTRGNAASSRAGLAGSGAPAHEGLEAGAAAEDRRRGRRVHAPRRRARRRRMDRSERAAEAKCVLDGDAAATDDRVDRVFAPAPPRWTCTSRACSPSCTAARFSSATSRARPRARAAARPSSSVSTALTRPDGRPTLERAQGGFSTAAAARGTTRSPRASRTAPPR